MKDWKDNILNSLEGMERAKPAEGTFQKISSTINYEKSIESSSELQWIAIAATVSLLIATNLYLVLRDDKIPTESNPSSYPSLVSNFNIYQNE